MSLEIELSTRPSRSGSVASVIRLIGVLDAGTAAEAQREFAIVATKRPPIVVIDLEKLEYLDSLGISTLLWARIEFSKVGSPVVLSNPQRSVRRVLEVVKALPSVPVFASTAELDAYLADVQEKARREDE